MASIQFYPAESNPAKVRILIIAPSLGILGGQAIQANRLLEQLRQESILEVSLLPVNPRLPGLAGNLQSIKYIRTLITSVVYGFSLLSRVRKYDVIHIFSASYFSFVLAPTPALLVARLYGKKSLLNYRSGEAEDHLISWRRTAIPIIRLADKIVVPSAYLVHVFAKFGLSCQSIPNFIDLDVFRFRDRVPLKPRFLSNRNLEPLYNVSCVLRAFSEIQKRIPEASLTVVGDGSERGLLEQLAKDLKLQRVVFAGRVEPSRMPEVYDAHEVYLNSPNVDNMPGSILEAFATGLPVVTTDAGGIPYIVQDGVSALTVAKDDHEAMASRALQLLEQKDLAARLISAGRRESLKYCWARVRDEWIRLYSSLANQEIPKVEVTRDTLQEAIGVGIHERYPSPAFRPSDSRPDEPTFEA